MHMKTSHLAADSSGMTRHGEQARRAWTLGLLGLAAMAGLCTSAGAQVLANAHDDFSGLQGFNGWYYGYFNGDSATPWSLGDFEQLPFFDIMWHRTTGPGGYWTAITPDGGHPNGLITSGGRLAEENWAVRRWIADGQYVLNVFGRVWDANPTIVGTGNGIIGYLMVDGATIWQGTVEAGNQHGLEYNLQFCTVPGTIVDFVIDPRASNDWADDTGFHSTIRTIIDHQPQNAMTCTGGTAEFEVITLPGSYTYQWRRNGDLIMHDGDMARLVIVNVGSPSVGTYDCIVTNECGSMISDAATLTICDADFDCDGFLDSRDFFVYIGAFFAEDPRADFNQDGTIDSRDFFNFLLTFFAGC
jgi:hypothetical protein